jgi:tRNA pseudouridine38-40 synthase
LTIQEVIEGALEKVLKTPTSIFGCGRTDTGVHAVQYFFQANMLETDLDELQFKLNYALPPEIVVFDILPVHDRASARFDAIQRQYDYFIHLRKDPFLQGSSALYGGMDLEINSMKAAVHLLPNYEDYYAFCKSPAKYEHTICRVSAAHLWVDQRGERLRFQISANRFLMGMIRIIVGRLLEIGTGRMTLEVFEGHLRDKKTPRIITGAHPQGLYLSKVVYPYLDLPQATIFSEVFGEVDSPYWV